MKTAYFDCFSGASGNMVIGAFLDAGVPLKGIISELDKLNLTGEYQLISERVKKAGIDACYFNVVPTAHHDRHRNYDEIYSLISESSLSPKVKSLSLQILRRLGEAEARVHRCSLQEVHFHEVGAVDTIIDLVGASYCIDYLGIQKVYASPLHVGSGLVNCAHGLLPIPAPATAELLKGASFYSTDIRGELLTPTGAAIITSLAQEFTPLPPLEAETISYGAGTWDLQIPNVLRLYTGYLLEDRKRTDSSTIIETTIDDMNPEMYSYLMDKLFAAGAADVYLTPVFMKKNRPGTLVTITSTLPDQQPLLDIIFSETTTIGVRIHQVQRSRLNRTWETVETSWGPVRLKISKLGDKIMNIAPEYEDCRTLAKKTGTPLKQIWCQALNLITY